MKQLWNCFTVRYILFFLLIPLYPCFAYESMIRHGYFSCAACHNSTSGGGTLNEYGKVIASSFSAFQLRTLNPSPPSWLKKIDPAIQLRFARVSSQGRTRNFTMQADILSTISLSKNSHIIGSLAKAPSVGENIPLTDELYLRKLLYVHKYKENMYLEIGRNSPPFGIHEPDHTNYIRSFNRRSVLDLPLQLSFSLYKEKNRHSFYLLLPSYQEDAENREYALALKEEFYLKTMNTLLGLDFLLGKTSSIQRYFGGMYTKIFFKSFLLLGEVNFVRREVLKSKVEFNQLAYLLKASYFPKNYLEFFISTEKLEQDEPFSRDRRKISFGTLLRVTENSSFLFEVKRQSARYTYITQLFFNLW